MLKPAITLPPIIASSNSKEISCVSGDGGGGGGGEGGGEGGGKGGGEGGEGGKGGKGGTGGHEMEDVPSPISSLLQLIGPL